MSHWKQTYLDRTHLLKDFSPQGLISSRTYLDGAARPCKIDGVLTMFGVIQAWCDFSVGASCSTVAKSQVCSSAADFLFMPAPFRSCRLTLWCVCVFCTGVCGCLVRHWNGPHQAKWTMGLSCATECRVWHLVLPSYGTHSAAI